MKMVEEAPRRGKERGGEGKPGGEERIQKDEVPSSGDSYRVSLGTHTCPLFGFGGSEL